MCKRSGRQNRYRPGRGAVIGQSAVYCARWSSSRAARRNRSFGAAQHPGQFLDPLRASPRPTPTGGLTSKPGTTNDGITVTGYAWGPGNRPNRNRAVEIHRLGPHLAGRHPEPLRTRLGGSTDLIDANEEMWRFFSKYELPDR
ncbi:MAG TPA: hypothetical protein VGY99_07680 [Candidatus Binataceae bacterium]|nr:hypothetical protein [Candidatus Binataceae bacterium]